MGNEINVQKWEIKETFAFSTTVAAWATSYRLCRLIIKTNQLMLITAIFINMCIEKYMHCYLASQNVGGDMVAVMKTS